MKNTKPEATAAVVDEILGGLCGDLQVGKKYYIFTGTYHYIGTVDQVSAFSIRLRPDALLVMNAGSASDAVSQIIAGKIQPASAECPQRHIWIPIAWISSYISWAA